LIENKYCERKVKSPQIRDREKILKFNAIKTIGVHHSNVPFV